MYNVFIAIFVVLFPICLYILLKHISKSVYTEQQEKEIDLGYEQGFDFNKIKFYANPKLKPCQMEQIRLGLRYKLDISKYADLKFSSRQMEQIKLGLKEKLDVSKYANFEFSVAKMKIMRLKLKEKKR